MCDSPQASPHTEARVAVGFAPEFEFPQPRNELQTPAENDVVMENVSLPIIRLNLFENSPSKGVLHPYATAAARRLSQQHSQRRLQPRYEDSECPALHQLVQ